MAITILVTGFGPFPGAPFNPTGLLVTHLARLRRPGLADATIVSHVFTTSYAAVDRELPALLHRHRPDVVLMFGLAPRAKTLRIETRARNTLALLPDAAGNAPRSNAISVGAPAALALPAAARWLLAAARRARVPVALSRDAGRYLCNYLSWRAAAAAGHPGGPRLAVFIHVPQVRRSPVPRRRMKRRRQTPADLLRAGSAILRASAAARR
jgi:pyroglutamyl-peptidase